MFRQPIARFTVHRIGQSSRFFFANPCSTDHSILLKNASVHRLGDDSSYGSREYVLVPEGVSADLIQKDPKLKLASIHAHRNIIFGAKVMNQNLGPAVEVCSSLLDAALQDASAQGEQPQAMATLHGLCDWVVQGLEKEQEIQTLSTLRQAQDQVAFEAVQAIATGTPRQGHSVVGAGTYRDGQFGWEELAREFLDRGLGEEAALYQSKGGELVAIEHLADHSEAYLKSAGGCMARFFFL